MQGLSTIPFAFYRLNTNITPNPEDVRATPLAAFKGGKRSVRIRKHKGQGRGRGRSRSRTLNKNKKSLRRGVVNYAGRQIGHLQQRQQQRQQGRTRIRAGAKSKSKSQSKSQSQSGGTMALPPDANLAVSSLGNLVQSGIATLRGLDGPTNPLPFSDTVYQRNL